MSAGGGPEAKAGNVSEPDARDRIPKKVNHMRRIFLFFVFTFSLCSTTLHGQSANQTTTQLPTQSAERNPWMRMSNNGAWWNTLSHDSKADFVDGYVSAMANVHSLLMRLVEQGTKEVTPGPKFDAQMSAFLQL